MPAIVPDLLFCEGRFQPGLALRVDRHRLTGVVSAADAGEDVERLPGRAILPGFVNAHSHAFQRLIRGRGQWRPADAPKSDFWSWREAMYAAALGLSADEIEAVSRFCFVEMLRAGYTTVGEFHYLHCDERGALYDDPGELAARVIGAARDAGIRIALLNVCYATGGVREPLRAEQRRFATTDLDRFLATTDALRARFRGDPLVTVGMAPHSVRAVPREWLASLHAWATEQDAPFHMHVSEQPAEVDACVAAYGMRPVELLEAEGVLDARLTAVHATHLDAPEIARFGDAGATVCACPTTERDLGDGVLAAADLIAAGARLAIGTDSQTVIDPFEEVRLIEYGERLRRGRRVVLAVPEEDGRLGVAPLLLEAGTAGGAQALRIDAGRFADGAAADFVAIDLQHEALAGWSAASLPAMLALTAPRDVVSDVWVGGVRRVADGEHPLRERAQRDFTAIAARLPD